MVVTGNETSAPVIGGFATGNFFEVVGLEPAYGRFFLQEEDRTGAEGVAVLSHGLWERRFGSEPDVVGDRIRINGVPVTVIGIAPVGFNGMLRGVVIDLWLPINASPRLRAKLNMIANRGSRGLLVFGRLRPGVSSEQAEANLGTVASALHDEYPDQWKNVRGEARVVSVLPEDASRVLPQIRGALLGFLALLMVVVGLVLMLACTNTANLLLARATARRKEIATRLSLGAGRKRLVRQLLTEAVLLSLLAGVAGILLALWSTRLIMAFQPPLPITIALGLTLDTTVMLFAVGLSLATGVVFGLVPALQATKANLASALRDETGGTGTGRHFLRGGLVVGQIAISVLLLVGAGLFLRSLMNADAIDPGFDPEGVLMASVDLRLAGYSDEEGRAFFETLSSRLASHPGVQAASLGSNLPLGFGSSRRGIGIEDYEPGPGEDMEVHFDTVGPGFFETMRIPLVRGREFTESDSGSAPGVVIVNEAFVRRYWPGQDPMGKHLMRGTSELEVIGIARDGKYVTLGEDPRPYVYFPHLQNYAGRVTLLLRTEDAPEAFAATLRGEIAALDPELPVYDVQTMTEHLGIALLPVRLASSLLGVFGAVALLLATGGLYGIMSYIVGQRAHEIGVRVSLGATPHDIVALVVRQGMLWTIAGGLLGLALAIGVTRFLTFLLYGISPSDPVTFVGIALVMAASAFLACYIPGRRATRLDPLSSLRSL